MAHNKALAIVDVQHGFNTNLDTQEVIKKLSDIDKDNYSMIVATKFINDNSSMFIKQLGYTKMFNEDDTEFLPIVKSLYDIQIPKKTYSGAESIIEALQSTSVQEVDVIGFDTDGCVLSTAIGLFDYGYKVNVIEDLCASSGGEDIHQAALAVLERCIGRDHVV